MEFISKEDLKELNSNIKQHDSLLRLKRRWLMDLPLTATEETRIEQLLSADTILPESLLREDDVSYEDIKNCIEMGFGVHKHGKEHHGVEEPVQIFKSSDDCKDIFFLLDSMTNKGLYSLCKTLTGGTGEFVKTKSRMRKTIKQQLRKVIGDKTDTSNALLKQLSQLMNNPNNFLKSQLMVSTSSPEAYLDATNKVLDGLEDLCTITLKLMRRKLLEEAHIPAMQLKRYKKGRDKLISSIRKICREMITDLSNGCELGEKLASALAIASLALKHLLNSPVAVNFRNFSPEVEALQNDIAKSIWLLSKTKRVSMIELRRVQPLLAPTLKLSKRGLRTGIRNLLTEYLFECGDMDDVPESLLKTLDIINEKTLSRSRRKNCRLSPRDVMKDEMQKEIECVSSLGAQAKQVLLDSLQKHDFDEDFARAYMENFEETDTFVVSDDDDDYEMVGNGSIHCEFDYQNSHNEAESICENTLSTSSLPFSTSHANCHSPAHSPNGSLNTSLRSRSINELDVDETQSLKQSEVQSGQYMKRKYKSTIKLEMDPLDPHSAATIRNIFSAPPSFAMDSSTNECKAEEFKVEQTNIDSLQSGFSNAYLEIQEACDATSMVAYRFVGQKLEKLAGTELFQGDRSYLLSGGSIPESSDESSESLLTSKLTRMWKDMLEC